MCVFVFSRAGSVVCASESVTVAWSKVSFALCVCNLVGRVAIFK